MNGAAKPFNMGSTEEQQEMQPQGTSGTSDLPPTPPDSKDSTPQTDPRGQSRAYSSMAREHPAYSQLLVRLNEEYNNALVAHSNLYKDRRRSQHPRSSDNWWLSDRPRWLEIEERQKRTMAVPRFVNTYDGRIEASLDSDDIRPWMETDRWKQIWKEAMPMPQRVKTYHERLEASKGFDDDDLWLPEPPELVNKTGDSKEKKDLQN